MILPHGNGAALGAVDDGNGLAPITLAGEHPVPELIVRLGLADALLLQPFGNDGNGLLHRQAIQEAGVDHDTGVVLQGKSSLFHVTALDHLHDVASEGLCKGPVTVIVGRHGHNGAGAVGGQNVVGNENGNLLAVYRIDATDTVQLHTGLVLIQLRALQVRLGGGSGLIGHYFIGIGQLVHPLLHQLMLGRQHHVGRAEQRIGAGGKNQNVVAQGRLEGDFRAVAAADPVDLLSLDPVDVIQPLQLIDESVGILGDTQHPLTLFLADNRSTAALANTLHHFLVGQNALAAGTPVNRHLRLIGQALLVHLQENPLGPLEILGICGIDLTIPVEAVAQGLKLPAEIYDVVLRHDSGMDVILDGIVLRRQAEGVIAHGEQHVHAAHSLLPGNDVHSRVGSGMTHMETGAGGIRELHQAKEFGLVAAIDGSIELLFLPDFLPFFFNLCKFVVHFWHLF